MLTWLIFLPEEAIPLTASILSITIFWHYEECLSILRIFFILYRQYYFWAVVLGFPDLTFFFLNPLPWVGWQKIAIIFSNHIQP